MIVNHCIVWVLQIFSGACNNLFYSSVPCVPVLSMKYCLVILFILCMKYMQEVFVSWIVPSPVEFVPSPMSSVCRLRLLLYKDYFC